MHSVFQGFWDQYQTRILFRQHELGKICPDIDADMRSFIDDMSMGSYGHEPEINKPEIYEIHGHMGEYFVKALKKKKCKVFIKTKIVGSKYSHKVILQAKLLSWAYEVKSALLPRI